MTAPLCFIDCETTGLDPRIHQPYEVAWWREDEPDPVTLQLPHTLEHADARALEVGGYWNRGFTPHDFTAKKNTAWFKLVGALRGVTLVGANPGFDAAMLRQFIGTEVWQHRMVDVSTGAMWVFGWDRPRGLGEVAAELVGRGFDIPEPDHTAEGDVRATRAIYLALRDLAVTV